MANEVIGIVGTGRMGTAIASRLKECGHEVVVWNRTPAHATAAVEAGARQADDLVALAASADVIITSLTDFHALRDVFEGPAGLLSKGLRGKLLIEMSTLLPEEEATLEQMAAGAAADFVECPVGGTVGPTLKGQLLGFAGGSERAWQRARPVLEKLCKRIEHLGPAGTGARMKLAVNLPLAIYWNVLGESLALLSGSGLKGEQIVSLLADSSAGPNVLRNRAQVVAATIDGSDQPGTFDIAGLNKDLGLALRLAESAGAKLPVAEMVQRSYRRALAQGLERCDGASLARMLADTPDEG